MDSESPSLKPPHRDPFVTDDPTVPPEQGGTYRDPFVADETNPESEPKNNRRAWIIGGIALVALNLAVLGLVLAQWWGNRDDDTVALPAAINTAEVEADTEEPATEVEAVVEAPEPEATDVPEPAPTEQAAPTAEPTTAPEPTPEPEPTAEPEPTPEPEPTAEPDPTAEPESADSLVPLSDLPPRGAVFRPPTLFLEGPVRADDAAAILARAIAVVGEDNVVNNYIIREDAPEAIDGTVRVERAVLFQTNSAVIGEDFIPVLNLGLAVMTLNPQVDMIVEGHTDSIGSEATNEVLSVERAQAVVDYLVNAGVEPSRVWAVGFGETQPVASNETDEGRQTNRRIEVQLLDLLKPIDG